MFKSVFLTIAAAFSFSQVILTATTASAYEGSRHRYSSSYRAWDQGFYSTYSYSESYSECNGYHTCFYNSTTYSESYHSWRDSDPVYVEEYVISSGQYNGYHKVIVYTDDGYSNEYCHYYIDGSRRVIYREYSPVVYVSFFNPLAVTEATLLLTQNFDSDLRALATAGGLLIDLGIDSAVLGGNTKVAGDLVVVGLLSESSASSIQASRDHQQTELQKNIQRAEQAQSQRSSRIP